jgi:pimeloyl-ACP methyl ester carboxylesterase
VRPRARTVRAVLLLVLAAVLAAGCGSGMGGVSRSRVDEIRTGPGGSTFYRPPAAAAPGTKPGQVIWIHSFPAPSGSRAYRMLYWSTTVQGALVAVSGVIVLPTRSGSTPPKIVAWAHGTSGLGDVCAPSHAFATNSTGDTQIAARAVGSGNVFVATDYQGLGTPGDPPYIVGQSAGRNVLDSIRAAAFVARLGPHPTAVVLGLSQGGGAALFTAQLQPTYAPDVDLTGAAAVSSPGPLQQLAATLDGGRYSGYTLMAIAGFVAAYPELRPALAGLTSRGRQALSTIGTECVETILGSLAGVKQAQLGTQNVIHQPLFRSRLAQNSAGTVRSRVPILLVAGEADDTIPVANSRALLAAYCRLGTPVEARFVAGAGHVDVLSKEEFGISTWALDRLSGSKPTNSCPLGAP